MARVPTKSADNIWCKARINAANYDKRLLSREGAAELLGMSVSSVSDAELGTTKVMPVDKAVLMADLYNAPYLLNYYCLHECPIGRDQPLSAEVHDIDKVTIKLLKVLRVDELERLKDTLLAIAGDEDGEIPEEMMPDLLEVSAYLDNIVKIVSELRTITKMAIRGRKK